MRPGPLELPNGFRKDVIGYCDQFSCLQGQTINFKLSAYTDGHARASIIELISGDDRPHGTGLVEELVEDFGAVGEIPYQPLVRGSYALLENMPQLSRGKVVIWVQPTLLDGAVQTILNGGGLSLSLSAGGFVARCGEVVLKLDQKVEKNRWYQLLFAFDDTIKLTVNKKSGGSHERSGTWETAVQGSLNLSKGDWFVACATPGQQHFSGRLEGLSVESDDAIEVEWDFARHMYTQDVIDVSGNDRHGRLFQTPTRGVCGVSWNGTVQSYHQDPSQYAAIHFHDDDITDAGWTDTLSWSVPAQLPSGQYALKIDYTASDGTHTEEHLPFFVRAKIAKSKIAYLAPTASYLAYANQRIGFAGTLNDPTIRHPNDAFLFAHEEVGYSMYEYHRDGSGVHFSSRLRPVMNFKPSTGTWAFNADTHVTHWLKGIQQPFDVVTDEDLHLEGLAAISQYEVVITGSHPEYYSTPMRDALKAYLGQGGRFMYLGGNGFYWRVAFDPENPAIMEVRRAEDGTRAWIAHPGEYYHQFTGEYGGLWRRLGQPPNELVGIGFAAQGFDGGTYYRVQSGALDSRVAFITQGVETSEIWGDFGNQGGGAAGEEIDRVDYELGSPAHVVVIATSEEHKPGMLRVKEEFHMTEYPRRQDSKVRADMVFFETPSGGAVFSTGSISYAGALAHNNFDNNIARITRNVLERFIDPTPFEYPDGD
ncbi:MAG: N,N-dimethylformamidase beta subunit family domain-containing protein [Pseudomonadota bacterium]